MHHGVTVRGGPLAAFSSGMWLRMLLSAMGLALGQHTSAEEGCSLSVWNSSTGPLGMEPADSKNTLSTLNLSLSGGRVHASAR